MTIRCLIALACALSAGVSAASAQTIAELQDATPISAYGGHLVWSQKMGSQGRYALMDRANDVTRRVPISTRRVPFDVDLGPATNGHVTAVYSRCAGDHSYRAQQPTGSGLLAYAALPTSDSDCRLYEVDLAIGKERRLARLHQRGASEVLPTLWRNRIAFVRVDQQRRGVAGALPRLEYAVGHAKPRGVRGGTKGTWSVGRRGTLPFGGPGPLLLDLRGARLLFSWAYIPTSLGCNGQSDERVAASATEVWSVRPGMSRTRLARACNIGAVSGPNAVYNAFWDGASSVRLLANDGSRDPHFPLRSVPALHPEIDLADIPVSVATDAGQLFTLTNLGPRAARAPFELASQPSG